MKKLSDYKGDDAIELWGELMEPIIHIVGEGGIRSIVKNREDKNVAKIAQEMIKAYKSDVIRILTIIDDTPINGLNILTRTISLLTEVLSDPDLRDFFGMSESAEVETLLTYTGSATENIEDEEN